MDEKIKSILADLAKSLARDYRRDFAFLASIAIEDDVGAVIRATGHIQDLLLQLVLRNVERPDLVKPSSYSYARLVFLARVFGEISDDLAKALEQLATIRNPLAHDLLHQLDPEAVRRFYDALPEGTTKAQMPPLLERHGFLADMSSEARLLRIGLILAGTELYNCRDNPLSRKRLPSERVQSR